MSLPLAVKDLDRKVAENPFNYTEDQLLEKQQALKVMRELYPDTPVFYNEMVYDLCKNNTQEYIDELKEKISSTPSRHPFDFINMASSSDDNSKKM
tara:strand:+ start:479 stop:766 length:288 start_codon:yes stop_codon:yes gene_type:complete